jgi:hypothetical protein
MGKPQEDFRPAENAAVYHASPSNRLTEPIESPARQTQ